MIRTALLVALAVCAAPNSWAIADDDDTLRMVRKAWETRAERTRSLRFSWTSATLQAATLVAPRGAGSAGDASYSAQMRLVLEPSRRVRFEETSKRWRESQGLIDAETIEVFDGDARTTLFAKGSSKDYPNAHIGPSNFQKVAKRIQMCPLAIVYFPLDPAVGILEPERLVIDESPAVINGRKAIGVRQPAENAEDFDSTVWVDPERDFLPLRYATRFKGQPSEQADITAYDLDEAHGFVPREWSISVLAPDGTPRHVERGTVQDYAINAPVADGDFCIEFPPGTFVWNRVTDEDYILRTDGSRRVVRAGEYTGDNYAELLRTESPTQLRGWKTYLLGANVLVILAVIGILLRNRVTTPA